MTVAECAAQCAKMSCTCFDFLCGYHLAANCTCPELPKVVPLPAAKKVSARSRVRALSLRSPPLVPPLVRGDRRRREGRGEIGENRGGCGSGPRS